MRIRHTPLTKSVVFRGPRMILLLGFARLVRPPNLSCCNSPSRRDASEMRSCNYLNFRSWTAGVPGVLSFKGFIAAECHLARLSLLPVFSSTVIYTNHPSWTQMWVLWSDLFSQVPVTLLCKSEPQNIHALMNGCTRLYTTGHSCSTHTDTFWGALVRPLFKGTSDTPTRRSHICSCLNGWIDNDSSTKLTQRSITFFVCEETCKNLQVFGRGPAKLLVTLIVGRSPGLLCTAHVMTMTMMMVRRVGSYRKKVVIMN